MVGGGGGVFIRFGNLSNFWTVFGFLQEFVQKYTDSPRIQDSYYICYQRGGVEIKKTQDANISLTFKNLNPL